MDIFGFKERKRIADEKAAKEELYNIALVKRSKEIFALLNEHAITESSESYENEQDRIKTTNSICPKCNSKNVNDRIQRTQGEIKGSSSGSLSGAAFFGFGGVSGQSSSSINGKIDTNEINKCNEQDCGHEWKKATMNYHSWSRNVEDYYDYLTYAFQAFDKVIKAEYDPLDIGEKFNSLEEKKADLLKSAEEGTWKSIAIKYFSGLEIECVLKIAEEEVFKSNWSNYPSSEFKRFMEVWDNDVAIIGFGMKKFIYNEKEMED